MGKTYLGAGRKRTNTPAENRKKAVEYRHEKYAGKVTVFTASESEPKEAVIKEIVPEEMTEEILLSEETTAEETTAEEEPEETEEQTVSKKKVSEFRRYSEAKFYAPRNRRTNTPADNRKRAVEYRHLKFAKKPSDRAAEEIPESKAELMKEAAAAKAKEIASDVKNSFEITIKKTGAFFTGLFASVKEKAKKDRKQKNKKKPAAPEEEPVKLPEEVREEEEIPADQIAEAVEETAVETEVQTEAEEHVPAAAKSEETEPVTSEEAPAEEAPAEEAPAEEAPAEEAEEETAEAEEETKQYQKPKTLKEKTAASKAKRRRRKLENLDEMIDRPKAGLIRMLLFPGTSMDNVSTAGYPTISMFSALWLNILKWAAFGSFFAVVLRDYISIFEFSIIQLNFTESAWIAFKIGIFGLAAEYFCYYVLFVITGLIRKPVRSSILVDVASRSSLASALAFLAACFAVHHSVSLGFAVMIGALVFEIVMKAHAIHLTVDGLSSTARFWIILMLVTLVAFVSFKYFSLALNDVVQLLTHVLNLQ